jgi:tripartite-type tricarboxylate transporter receptor subunit TctC
LLSTAALFVAASIVPLMTPAMADPIADFYRGKQLKLVIRAAPGGNYDLYMRLLGRHIVRHIPGNPTAIPMNMPGGGGLLALNYAVSVAPHDGTVLTMVTQTTPMDQALGLDKNLKVDMRKLNWIGNMSDENSFVVTTKNSPAKTLEDARRREVPLAATGAGGVEILLVSVLNNVLGTRFKPIVGYRSGPEMNLAMERGEAEARTTTNLRALFATSPKGAADFNVIVQGGVKKDKNYPNVPFMSDMASNANDKLVLDFISRVLALARPVATNEDVPPERIAALRRAFDATMVDPEFLAEAKQQDLDISAWQGEELQRIVTSIVDTPAPDLERIRQALREAPSEERKEPPR